MEFWIPYGATDVAVAVPDENLLGFLTPLEDSTSQDLTEIVADALKHQIGGTTFLEAASQTKKMVVAFNGKSITSTSTANLLVAKLIEQGVANVELLEVASDPTEPRSGGAPAENANYSARMAIKHDAKASPTVKVGQLEDGTEIFLNDAFANADMRCIVANVALNPFWGYSGGPSFVVPGLASEKTVKACLAPRLKSERLPGVLSGNPTYETLLRASQMTRIDFAIHIVERPDGKVAGVFSGELVATFEQACATAARVFRPPMRQKADIVITSAGGAPWDLSLFEASPSALMAANICKDQGIVILVAECSRGLGGFPSGGFGGVESKARLAYARRFFSLDMLLEHAFRKVSGEHRVYLVSTLPEHQASLYELLDAKSVKSALERAIRHAGKEAKIAVIPYGSHTLPVIEKS